MAENNDKAKRLHQRIKEIGELIGDAIILTVNRPDSGQPPLTEEDKAKVKERVGEAFATFLEHREWKEKTDPVLNDFRRSYLPKALKLKMEDKDLTDEIIKEVFPSLDGEFESHAILNMIAHMASVGPFRKIKDETVARIIEDEFMIVGIVLAYLSWRVQTTTPSKEEQH